MALRPIQLLKQNWELLPWDMQMGFHEWHKVPESLPAEGVHQ
jgi:hypothetical protein